MSSAEALLHDLNDPQKRAAAILSLGEIAHTPALDHILAFTKDADPQVRRAVMTALAAFEGDRVMAAIIGGIHDSDATVRTAAQAAWAKWVLKNVLQLTGGERGYVVLKNPETGAMEFSAGERIDAEQAAKPELATSQAVIQEVARKGETILTDNASMDARFQSAESIVGYSLRQLIAVPLKDGDEVLGVVYCDKRLVSGLFNPGDLQHLSDFTDEAVALTHQPLPVADIPDWLRENVNNEEASPDLNLEAEVDEIPDWLPETLEPYDESLRGGAAEASPDPGDFDDDEFLLDDLRGGGAELEPEAPVEVEEGYEKASKPITQPDSDQPATPKPIASDVNFSAYYPAEAVAQKQQGLYVYAHLPNLAPTIEQDVKQFKEQLGGTVPAPRVARQTAQLQHGTLITVMPECDELDFEPAAVTKKWNGEWTRFDFSFTPKADMVGDSLFVRVSISVSGVEIAHIKCPIEVIAQPQAQISANNPLAAAKMATQTARMYHRIFVSYSRKDTQVAEAYRLAQMAIGNDVFMDSYSIRVGEDWRAALARAIDDADIFQLFWSSHAAESENVRDEWDYALNYKCPDHNCTYFIRPVFWDKPMPQPPSELSHLNFRYVPFEGLEKDATP